jgi:NADH:ubiquinone oxidoreductase subunit
MANFYYGADTGWYSDAELTIAADISTITSGDAVYAAYGSVYLQSSFPGVNNLSGVNLSGVQFVGDDWQAAQGYHLYVYFVNGQATTLDENGSGWYEGVYYITGVATTLPESGTGWDSNSNVYYLNGVVTTLDQSGSGFDGKAYYEGSEQPTGWNGYFYYINNVETTLDPNGNGFMNGVIYTGGQENPTFTGRVTSPWMDPSESWTGEGSFIGYYINGQLTNLDPQGSSQFSFPYDQNLYNGKFYVNGVPYTGADLDGGLTYNRKFTDGLPSAGYAESYSGYKGFYDENGFPMQGWFTVAQGAPDTNGRGGTYFWNYGPGATTLDENGSGWYEYYGAYYINNVDYYGPDSTGTGYASHADVYLVNGVVTSLDSSGNGFHDGKAYYNGSEQPTGWNGYFYYVDNAETPLNNYGHSAPYDSGPYNFPYEDYLYNGLFYFYGTPYTGVASSDGGSVAGDRKFIDGLPASGFFNGGGLANYDGKQGFYGSDGFPVQGWFTVAQGAPDTNGRGGTYFWNYGPGATPLDENGSGWYEYYGAYCINNVEYYGPDSTGTGYASHADVYLVNGVVTSLDSSGNGFHDGKAYYNGSEQPTGWNGYFYYVNNVETALDSLGNGAWQGLRYENGTLFTGDFEGQAYVNGVVQGGGGGSVNLESGLQAFYKLSDTSDSSGNNRTLTNNGNVSFASGKLGNAAVFDGSNFLQSNVQQPSTAMTVSVWAKLNNTNGPRFLIDSVTGNNWSGGGFGITTDNGSVNSYVFHGGEGGEGVALSTGSVDLTLSTDVWYHIVGTHDTSTGLGKLYINGSLNNSVQHNRNDPFGGNRTNPVAFGSNADGTYGLLDGQIDAVGIWNRALSEAEVAELYNNGTGLELPAGPAVKNGWIDGIFWINDVATTLDQNGDGTWVGKLYENGSLFSGSKYSLTFVNGVAQAEQIVTVIGSNIPVAFGLNEAEEPLVELVFASITSAGETTVEQIIPTVLPTGYTVAETVLAYSIDTTATFEGSINVDFILPSNTSQTVFDRVKGFHVKNSGAIEEMTRVSSDFSTKRITVAITSFSDFLFLDQPQTSGKLVKIQGKTKFSGKVKFGV